MGPVTQTKTQRLETPETPSLNVMSRDNDKAEV